MDNNTIPNYDNWLSDEDSKIREETRSEREAEKRRVLEDREEY